MLGEAHRRRSRGTDVVVGLVETHGRRDTAEQLEGLEELPRREVPHRGGTRTELDVDAVLTRHPEVVVDELVHTNAPGSRNPERWQDVDEILGAGIDVPSTVDAQDLVTVHGPVNPAVDPAAAPRETGQVAARLDAGRLLPSSPHALSTSIVSALASRMRDHLADRTTDGWRFEQQVTAGTLGDAEQFLDGMIRVRHGLLAVRTMASLSHEVYARMHALDVYGAGGRALLDNSLDQFKRLATMARSQEEYLQGVIEFYRTRTNTKMTIAAERLAVIASITLPITALSSVMGMDVIVNSTTDPVFLTVLISVMALMSVLMLIWAKRRGWW